MFTNCESEETFIKCVHDIMDKQNTVPISAFYDQLFKFGRENEKALGILDRIVNAAENDYANKGCNCNLMSNLLYECFKQKIISF